MISPIVRGRPFLLLDRNSGRENVYRNADLSSSSQTSAQSSKVASPRKGPVRLGLSLTRRGNETVHGAPEGKEIDDDWTLVSTHGSARTVLPVPTTSSERAQGASEGTKGKIREWSEGDFPPLSTNIRSAEIKKVEKDRLFHVYLSLNHSNIFHIGSQIFPPSRSMITLQHPRRSKKQKRRVMRKPILRKEIQARVGR